jgi:excinuclease ABC subunit A
VPSKKAPRPAPECIRLRGVRQNNLKGFDLDLPLGRLIVVTGLSGAGKSSLVFETLHAEGQRRYVETFSAYTRQFLDLLDKPRVDSIENIRPSIAIEQKNTVKTSRSTVGTMTELTDYAKVWFSHVARCFDPATGEPVEDDNPRTIWEKTRAAHAGRSLLVTFRVPKPDRLGWPEILGNLQAQSYVRVLLPGAPAAPPTLHRVDELLARPEPLAALPQVFVVQDRIEVAPAQESRFLEATETALHFGQGEVRLFAGPDWTPAGHYSRGLHSPGSGRTFRAATPALFSFNSPLGACPKCRGFGRVIEIDYRLAIPDQNRSIDDGAIRCWEGEVYGASKEDLRRVARRRGIPTHVPLASLTEEQRDFVINGEPGYGEEGREWPKHWYGVKGFFRWLEKNTYKMHVRVFLSRYRSYVECPECHGHRLQPEALCWKWRGRTLPELYRLPVSELLALLGSGALPLTVSPESHSAGLALESMLTRLRYLERVGLGYLTLDRPSKTLSGGEVQRVNLTGCLGTSLVDTLFVLDEPSVGLHPRDVDRLIAIMRTLTDAGNTVVVVEHDEAVIRAADHVLEIGPEPGQRGGHVVFQGSLPGLLASRDSVTGAYLSGRNSIPVPPRRRPVTPGGPALELRGISKHNLAGVDLRLPLHRLVCLSGVSGSGKSTLLDHAVYQGLLTLRHQLAEDPAVIGTITGAERIGEIVLVDQSPLSRTPRSNPALYTDAWELIRELYAATPAAQAAGFSASSFSFNAGDGRCGHCLGLGYDRVEMQFLSDVFVPCPVCDGRRFVPEVLAISWRARSVADLLATSVDDALALFADEPAIRDRLEPLAEVGLGYLTLGQPLNTLSGGESQRLKLVQYLGDVAAPPGAPPGPESPGAKSAAAEAPPPPALLLLDEPTTGLHRHDVKRLLAVLHALVDRGHSVVVIEHNLDVLKSADWILEIGPGAGAAGGRIIAEGPPETVARTTSATSLFLQAALQETSPPSDTSARGLAVEEPAAPLVTPGELRVVGARENNLKNLSVAIPHRKLTVVTGVSGSGKSTLAFDIIFAEGQRRFMESMSPYARQFVEQMPRPALDRLTGIPPTVAIEQRVTRGSRKSTVATITEVAQYLRLLYARLGVQHHPESDRPVTPLSPAALRRRLAQVVATHPKARKAKHLYLCAPLIRGRKGHHQPIATWIAKQGYALMRVDGQLVPVEAFQKLDRYREHDIEVVVGDLRAGAAPAGLLDDALALGKGSCFLVHPGGEILSWFSSTRTDVATGESFPELEPKHFSFNSPRGWCPTCRGHGRVLPWMLQPAGAAEGEEDPLARLREFGLGEGEELPTEGRPCPDCHGARLNRLSRAVKLHFRGRRPPLPLPGLLRGTAAEVLVNLRELALDTRGRLVTQDILPQIEERLKFLDAVGLGYLALDRSTATLSGGEAQRIRLAAQLGSNLTGVLYVLDEPSIGLHAADNERLIRTLEALRAKGNTLLVVEHDDELMARADRILDLGPGAGIHGGELLAEGTPAQIRRSVRSLTGLFLAQGIRHPLRGAYRSEPPAWLELTGATLRNLRGLDLRLPLGRLVMVAGPSGAGKSTLFRDLLGPAVGAAIKRGKGRLSGREFIKATGWESDDTTAPPPFRDLRGAAGFRAVIEVDQAPIGKTPRSTPATYLGIFDLIRQFFATLPESKVRGYRASRFSFNTAGGRCPACEGAGRIKLEMAFMPETYLGCDDCRGLRYGPELAGITWKGKNIGEVLQLTFDEAAAFFDFHSQLSQVCRLMVDCGLGYLTLGQSSPTLSGGEAQRLKLVTELSRGLASYRERSRGEAPRNLYLLEEPTIGLHLSDCEKLIHLLHALVDQGHSVIVIEHHLDLLAEADWLVEIGPGGGPAGGRLVYQGPLAGLPLVPDSPTAPFLREKLAPVTSAPRPGRAPSRRPARS